MIKTQLTVIMNYLVRWIIKLLSSGFFRKYKIRGGSYQSVFVLCGAGIGDAVMATPMIEAIKKHNAKTRIMVISNNTNADVFKFNPSISKQIIYSDSQYSRLKSCCLILCTKCDVFIGTQPSNTIIHSVFAFISLAKIKAKINKMNIDFVYEDYDFLYDVLIPNNKKCHRVELNMDIARSIGLISGASHRIKCKIYFSKGQKQMNSFFFNADCVTVHLGGGRKQKIWPIENYFKIISYLLDKKKTVIIVGGNEERGLISKIGIDSYVKIIDLVGKLKLNELHAVLQRSSLLITNDTGVMHIGAATNVKIIALFGNTEPLHIGPYTDTATIISGGRVNDISVEEVINSINQLLNE